MFRTGFARCPLDGEPIQELAGDPLGGSVFADRYVIEECIGEGGMGRVYSARHMRVSRRFAIKVLFGEYATDPKMRERFAREAESASRLSHPNVISVTDFGETREGLLFLVMDLVEGRELAAIINAEAPMEPDRAVALVRQLALGLDHAHTEGLVHRDFKPENVIVTVRGGVEVARIVDFGIAVPEDGESSRITTEGIILGTPAYMSPEQATGKALDGRADLFALGVMFYTMVAGVGPFDGEPLAIARQNLSKPPPPLGERVPGLAIDPELEAIIVQLMAKRPDERHSSAAAVVAALERLGSRRRSGAATAPDTLLEPEPAVSPQRRWRLAPWIAAAAAALVALTVVMAALGGGEANPVALPSPDAGPSLEADAAVRAALDVDAAGEAIAAAPMLDAAAAAMVDASPEPAARRSRIRAAPRPDRRRDSGNAEVRTASPAAPAISEASLTALYVKVGEGIEAVAAERGERAVADLRNRYRRIPFSDALRKPAIRGEVEVALRALSRAVRRSRGQGAP